MRNRIIDATGFLSGILSHKGRAQFCTWAHTENHQIWRMNLEGILGVEKATLDSTQRRVVMHAAMNAERRMGIPDPRPCIHGIYRIGDQLLVTFKGWN